MGRPRKIYPSRHGVDFVNLDVNRGVRGVINTPCFYLDGKPFAAPTVWLATEFTKSLESRRTNASRLRSYLNGILDDIAQDMTEEERKDVSFDFWKHVTKEDVEGYFFGVLREDRCLAKTSIFTSRASVQSFYGSARDKGWIVNSKSHLFDGIGEIEEESEIHLPSQYIESELSETLLNQLHKKYPNTEGKSEKARRTNERRRFYRARDRLVMDLGYEGGLRTCEVSSLTLEQLLPKLEAIIHNNKITGHIKISVIRKGGKLRELDISQRLCQKIYNFIRHERKKRISCNIRSSATERSGPLICSEAGKRMGKGHGTRVFCMLRKLALIEDIPCLLENLEETGTPGWWLSIQQIAGHPDRHKSALSFHALRHTYLTNLAIDNPGEHDYIKQQAGHASQEITYEVYVEFGVRLEKKRCNDARQRPDTSDQLVC